jgi:hypothetical protein
MRNFFAHMIIHYKSPCSHDNPLQNLCKNECVWLKVDDLLQKIMLQINVHVESHESYDV